MASGLNKYLHGSVWSWVPGEHALIISNDEQNIRATEVICLSVTNNQNGASVSIDKDTHIQCNQIHMVEKEALTTYEGNVPAAVLATVKTKLGTLLNMSAEPSNLQSIRDTAAKLVGQLAEIDAGDMPVVVEAPVVSQAPHPLQPVIDLAADASEGNVAPNVVLLEQPKEPLKPRGKPGPKPSGRKTKKTVVKAETSKPKRVMRRYTDEDEAFVLDGNPTTEQIMERFGYTEKRKVHDLKFLLKKRRKNRLGQ